MPTIDMPEEWFHTRKKDRYVLHYRVDEDAYSRPDRAIKALVKKYYKDEKVLAEWFSENLPTTEISIVGGSEFNDYFIGNRCVISVDFDESSLAKFNETFGRADSLWWVEIQSYAKWLDKVHSCRLLSVPLVTQQKVRWWDTPTGIILMSKTHDGDLLPYEDAWWLLQQLIPELRDVYRNAYPFGEYILIENNEYSNLIAIDWGDYDFRTWNGEKYGKDQSCIHRLRQALGIPERNLVRITVGY